jgi:type II secretion system (T2SS) protein B
MSYILDALKKSQTEQAGDGVALRVQQSTSNRSNSTWLAFGLVLVLLVNLGLLLWIFVFNNKPLQPSGNVAAPMDNPAVNPAPVATQQPLVQTEPVAAPNPNYLTSSTEASATFKPTKVEPTKQAPSTVVRQTVATTNAPLPASDPPVALSTLPAAEQVLYRGFNYSSHIYTDDPSLCAIVIDGQRLKAGDAFKGLKVTAITEQGVVFEENRRGQTRRIAVSIIELWDS